MTVASTTAPDARAQPFEVRLDNFEGPFDLLLGLIGKHELDVTEVALSRVTDEFIAHVRRLDRDGGGSDLGDTTEFLVVAATLLDLKAARLLPQAEVEDTEDLALLEARDLLFARLLQYRAFKQVAGVIGTRLAEQSRRHPRAVGLDERYAGLLPELVVSVGPERLAQLAAVALQPRDEPGMPVAHLHAPTVSVREQVAVVAAVLRRAGAATFRTLVTDAPDTATTVARFLALLDLYRDGQVTFAQVSVLGELHVRWTGGDS